MYNIKIKEDVYKLPEGWHEVTLKKYKKIIVHNTLMQEYKSKTLFAIELFAILLECDVDLLKKMSQKDFNKLSEKISWANKKIIPTNKKQFQINGDLYVPVKNMNDLSMGEAVDLETIINDSRDEELLINLLPILIRKAKTIVKDGENILVPSDYDMDIYNKTKQLFEDNLNVADVIKFRDFFLNLEK